MGLLLFFVLFLLLLSTGHKPERSCSPLRFRVIILFGFRVSFRKVRSWIVAQLYCIGAVSHFKSKYPPKWNRRVSERLRPNGWSRVEATAREKVNYQLCVCVCVCVCVLEY